LGVPFLSSQRISRQDLALLANKFTNVVSPSLGFITAQRDTCELCVREQFILFADLYSGSPEQSRFCFHSPLARRKKKEKKEKVAESPHFLHDVNAEASTRTAASQINCWAGKNNALVTVVKKT
jgi:hypothetical protein